MKSRTPSNGGFLADRWRRDLNPVRGERASGAFGPERSGSVARGQNSQSEFPNPSSTTTTLQIALTGDFSYRRCAATMRPASAFKSALAYRSTRRLPFKSIRGIWMPFAPLSQNASISNGKAGRRAFLLESSAWV
jgi:hypothetical protein